MIKNELEKHNKFLLKQLELTSKKIIRIVYRGDSLLNLCKKLGIVYRGPDTNFDMLLERLFMVGEKGKRYHMDLDSFMINDTDESVYEKIADYFKVTIRNKNIKVANFFETNEELKKYFSTSQNKQKFVDTINKLKPKEKLAVRNYYLILLHQLSAIKYRDKSHFVSTSVDYRIAKKFSGSIDDQIILHCWQPITHNNKQIVKKCSLPIYTSFPYSYQKEITIYGAIFPHFISGIEVALTKRFYPNPHIFNTVITRDTFLFGLNIDQKNFKDMVRLTNYKKTIASDGIDIWENKIST